VVIPAGAHHAWRNRSNAPIRMSTFFSPGGVEELYPNLVGLSLEELSTVVEAFGSGIVGPPIGGGRRPPRVSDFAVRVVAAAEAGGRHRFDLVGFSLGAAVSPQVLPLPNMRSMQ
jgi:hypothetical protein